MVRSLWKARGRMVGESLVSSYECRIPGTLLSAPCIQVCTKPNAAPNAYEDHVSTVWALTAEGKPYAERIARDIARCGWAVAWPHETAHVRAALGAAHAITQIASAREEEEA